MLFHLRLQHMCSLESEFESQMGEFHVKMKGKLHFSLLFLIAPLSFSPEIIFPDLIFYLSGLAGFARLCAGDQYEVGNARWCAQTVAQRRCSLPHLIGLPLGSHALREAAVEAARPRGGQQQTDVGQRGVHLSASCRRIAVNQGSGIRLPGGELRPARRATLVFSVKHLFVPLLPR